MYRHLFSYLTNTPLRLRKLKGSCLLLLTLNQSHTGFLFARNQSMITTHFWLKLRNFNLAYHTYPIQTLSSLVTSSKACLVTFPLKKYKLPEISGITGVKIVQIMETDKTTQIIIAKFPVFVVTFQHGTEVCDVFKIKRSMSYIIQLEKYKIKTPLS
jgi:hypothetical protein